MLFDIAQLAPEFWQQYRDLRLEAVKTDPQAFGMSYEEELERSQEQWIEFLHNIWFARVDNTIVGMIGLVQDTGKPGRHRGYVISFWVKPEYRGQGIGKLLIQHLQNLACEQGLRKLYLRVTVTQQSAIKLYELLGFEKVALLKDHACYDGTYFDQYLMEWYSQ